MTDRRTFLLSGAALLAATTPAFASKTGENGTFEVMKTPEEWKAILTENQYLVLREEKTERAFTSPLDKNTAEGIYHCAGCDNPLYSSETKFDSGTGWPSFWAPIEGKVGTKDDFSWLGRRRTEVHCARCGGHQGHVFDDGPKPTGKRHCINGLALTFKPSGATTG